MVKNNVFFISKIYIEKGAGRMENTNIINELNEITNLLDATTEVLVGLQENAKNEDAMKNIDVDLYLESPIQQLATLANRLANLSSKIEK